VSFLSTAAAVTSPSVGQVLITGIHVILINVSALTNMAEYWQTNPAWSQAADLYASEI
jgi:hypothetical protein